MTSGGHERGRPPADAGLWQAATRGVVPLRGRRPAAPPAMAASPSTTSPMAAEPVARKAPGALRASGIDRATAERLRRGLRPIEGRLDLHGMTRREAHVALADFIEAARTGGRRCLLVITGHGLGTGILKSAVPRWLGEGELRRQILAVAPAQPQHGGAGAYYVLLRRQR